MLNTTLYSVEIADTYDGVTTSVTANGGYHYHTEALAEKMAALIPMCEVYVIAHTPELHDAHVLARPYVGPALDDDIPF